MAEYNDAYKISLSNRVHKNYKKLPQNIKDKFVVLINDLSKKGPVLTNWNRYSKLSKYKYHCHLGYKYVACWTCKDNSISIDVYYVGSREDAPY